MYIYLQDDDQRNGRKAVIEMKEITTIFSLLIVTNSRLSY